MNSQTSAINIYDKLSRLEIELQRLKIEAYFALPQEKRSQAAVYSQKAIEQAVKDTRNKIWQERYADKTADLS